MFIEFDYYLGRVWTSGILSRLEAKVQLGYVKNNLSGMRASGIPPTVQIAQRLKVVEDSIESLVNVSLKKIPVQVVEEVMKNLEINGAVAVTHEQMLQGLDDLRKTLLQEVRLHVPTGVNCGATSEHVIKTFTWGGRFHMVPEGFLYPKGRVDVIWDLWWNGIPCDGIGPLRKLKSFDLVKSVDTTNFSKSKKIIQKIVEHSGVPNDAIIGMSDTERRVLYEKGYVSLCQTYCGTMDLVTWDNRRMNEISYITLYDTITKRDRKSRKKLAVVVL